MVGLDRRCRICHAVATWARMRRFRELRVRVARSLTKLHCTRVQASITMPMSEACDRLTPIRATACCRMHRISDATTVDRNRHRDRRQSLTCAVEPSSRSRQAELVSAGKHTFRLYRTRILDQTIHSPYRACDCDFVVNGTAP
jgi:hypothetical protein